MVRQFYLFTCVWWIHEVSSVKLLASCCDDRSLEMWYYFVLILFAGYLKNAEVSVDAISIWYDSIRLLLTFFFLLKTCLSIFF